MAGRMDVSADGGSRCPRQIENACVSRLRAEQHGSKWRDQQLEHSNQVDLPEGGLVPERLTGGTCYGFMGLQYVGVTSFTDRQLVALTTFSDLVAEARKKMLSDARVVVEEYGPAANWLQDTARLAEGGTGAQAYADAVATYSGTGSGPV